MRRPLGRCHSASDGADRVGQRAHRLDAASPSPRRALRRAAADRACASAEVRTRCAAVHVARVGGEDRAGLRAQRCGRGRERGVLLRRWAASARARAAALAARPSRSISALKVAASMGGAQGTGRRSQRHGRGCRRFRAQEHQVVAMDHLVAAAKAEQLLRSRRTCARGCGPRPHRNRRRCRAPPRRRRRSSTLTVSPRSKRPRAPMTPAGSRLCPRAARAARPASM